MIASNLLLLVCYCLKPGPLLKSLPTDCGFVFCLQVEAQVRLLQPDSQPLPPSEDPTGLSIGMLFEDARRWYLAREGQLDRSPWDNWGHPRQQAALQEAEAAALEDRREGRGRERVLFLMTVFRFNVSADLQTRCYRPGMGVFQLTRPHTPAIRPYFSALFLRCELLRARSCRRASPPNSLGHPLPEPVATLTQAYYCSAVVSPLNTGAPTALTQGTSRSASQRHREHCYSTIIAVRRHCGCCTAWHWLFTHGRCQPSSACVLIPARGQPRPPRQHERS